MSGHSKWQNIKHRKEAQDQKRGKVFSKYARLIAVAVKEGGSTDPEFNAKLKMTVERAKIENMPKENIQRAIESAAKKKEAVEEVILEGYGPGGIAIFVEAISDNRQRTIQEIKNIFSKNEGSLAEPGSVAFQFDKKGLVEVQNPKNEEKTLQLIDFGAEEIEEDGEALIIWVSPEVLESFKDKLTQAGFSIKRVELAMKPKAFLTISDPQKAKAALRLLELLEDHDDVQQVSTNVDILEEMTNGG